MIRRDRESPTWYWRESQSELARPWERDEPREPEVGQGWFNARTRTVCVWDGSEWVCVPAD